MKQIVLASLIVCSSPLIKASEAESPLVAIQVSQVRVSWASQSNQIYQLQYRMAAGTEPWTDLGFPIQGNGETLWIEDAVEGEQRLYRVMTPTNAVMATNMVWIQPGEFTMGSLLMANELPLTQVTISKGFWIGAFEVTQQEYLDVTGENPSYFRAATHPVDSVTWISATNYCALLTTREQAAGRIPATYEYRLPTEAEWEYACRAGTTGLFSFGDDEAELDYFGWFSGNSGFESHTVGHKQPNPWGLHDLHGNLWEWCLGWYTETHPGGSVTDPTGPLNGSDRALRGGGWFDAATYSRSASRNYHPPDYAKVDFGFRVVLAPN